MSRQGRTVRLFTAEDIDSLDVAHIRRWVQELAQITSDADIVARAAPREIAERSRGNVLNLRTPGRHGHRVPHAASVTLQLRLRRAALDSALQGTAPLVAPRAHHG